MAQQMTEESYSGDFIGTNAPYAPCRSPAPKVWPMPRLAAFSLVNEENIVWLEPRETLPYVRERYSKHVCFRTTRPKWNGPGRLVGYATLNKNEPSSNLRFNRRTFWVAEHDRCNDPTGIYRTGAPVEAVDPLTVKPGQPGELTERAWGAPLQQSVAAGSAE